MRGCAVEGCESQRKARGWCDMHYQRWRTHGDPTTLPERQVPYCAVEGCPRPTLAKGWCQMHYARWWRHGDLTAVLARGRSEVVGYRGAHYRVRSTRGSAALHVCPCGQPAAQWAYDNADPAELVADKGQGQAAATASTPRTIWPYACPATSSSTSPNRERRKR